MSVDKEIVLARELACGEPPVRARTFRQLTKHCQQLARNSNEIDEPTMERLCRGLYYALWMQDKMLLQEELVDRIADLCSVFTRPQDMRLYVRLSFSVLSREWPTIDQWRIEKFLMMIRRVLRTALRALASRQWPEPELSDFLAMLEETVLCCEGGLVDGVKMQFATVLLDELDGAGGCTDQEILNRFLEPYIKMMASGECSDRLFRVIHDEIWKSMLHLKSEEVNPLEDEEGEEDVDMGSDSDDEENAKGQAPRRRESKSAGPSQLSLDYAHWATRLFDAGRAGSVRSARRKKLYDLSKRMTLAAENIDPLDDGPKISERQWKRSNPISKKKKKTTKTTRRR